MELNPLPNYIEIVIPCRKIAEAGVPDLRSRMTLVSGGCTVFMSYGSWIDNNGSLVTETCQVHRWNFPDHVANTALSVADELTRALLNSGEQCVMRSQLIGCEYICGTIYT